MFTLPKEQQDAQNLKTEFLGATEPYGVIKYHYSVSGYNSSLPTQAVSYKPLSLDSESIRSQDHTPLNLGMQI